ncbi:pyridoxal phosphate-dependent aminotransferase [Microbacter margulisiae]|uniref:Aminotransferase n=1 Tax=Microbacter margulisiae TaxID=1350067 RepID=A0A7W5H2I5_9PORP|nr:pyridoxal phosphate-dependent aminotransferase [Microbacter margulisiae]MBB3187654.1 aspartate/methionine/tyrosine aminotransferase [Microbacter margulisiae]
MISINPDAEKMTPFIVMEVLERASELEKQGISVIHLEVGEPDFDVPPCVATAATLAQQQGKTHYTHSLGAPDLREAICRFYQKEYGVSVTPDRVLVTSGSSPAILMILMALCNAGDEVIMTNPGYACYRNFVLACRAVPVDVEVRAETGFQYEMDLLRKTITPRTRTLFINSPMNPSGILVEDKVFEALAQLDFPVISDEIYHGLVYNGRARSILEFTDNAFVVNGFSKRFAMTGLRLGYLIAPPQYMRTLQILQQNLFICAPSTAQAAGIAALEQADPDVVRMRTVYDERRVFMIRRLREIGFEIKIEPQGAFYVLADARKFTDDSYHFAFDVLENAHVGITPGVDFGTRGEGFVRFSYANSLENIAEGLERLEKYLHKLKTKE